VRKEQEMEEKSHIERQKKQEGKITLRASKYFKVKSLSFRSFVALKECILASLILNTAIYQMSC